MGIIKLALLFALIFIYISLGLILQVLFTFTQPKLRFGIISNLTKEFSVFLRRILRIDITVRGSNACLKESGNLIVSNHQSYLDGVILASLFPLAFVSKLQVKSWPIFGLMAWIGGTVFIKRENKLESIAALEKIINILKSKVNVLIFPEGTSTDGSKVLPFQSIFFQAPILSRARIIPITIQYTKINSQNISLLNRDRVCWYGQIKFFKHILELVKLNNIAAEIKIHPEIKIESVSGDSKFRKELSRMCREVILKDFSLLC
jgi:1-acyl-sn-glycerol-3-phosphate acyltransferase